VYQASPLHAAGSIQEIWLAFAAGATLVAPVDRHGEPAKRLAKARVTVLSCSPARLTALGGDVPSLRLLILRGGEIPEQLVARWTRADRRIVGTYGHAETTVMATYADLQPGHPVTLGRPLPGCRVYLMDEDLRFVRRGEVGEICVGGLGVARGYLGLPAETCARFVQDPFASGGSDARMYRTGELGRIGANGNLEYHGSVVGPRLPVPSTGGWR
jgi:non-ribosomal peptide synthetase component F